MCVDVPDIVGPGPTSREDGGTGSRVDWGGGSREDTFISLPKYI
jgi:hypothetical protein